ncbi:hypothetical protein [Aliivibrio kagoshimensis]|uniref:hypothetical protein n=1 Tax=Aliivibrio kagoshimensis TaxID=2910230 RepID=UPI003D104EAA
MFQKSWLGYVFMDAEASFFDTEIELTDGVLLRKASVQELNHHFDFHLERWWNLRGGTISNTFGRTITEGVHVKSIPNRSDWNHLVVECTNKKINFWTINQVFSMSKADLRMGYISIDDNGGSNPWSNWSKLGMWIENDLFTNSPQIKMDDIDDLKLNIGSFSTLDLNSDLIQKHLRLLNMFNHLDTMVDSCPFKYLGYFSIIEGLLTHKPNSSDNVDSIQKQLIRNVHLVNNRIISSGRKGINYGIFNGVKLKTVYSKLYSLRSAIAHGSDYSKSIEEILKLNGSKLDTYNASRPLFYWIKDLVKLVLMYSFVEPQLYFDLTSDVNKW